MSLKELAAKRHKEMAPLVQNSKDGAIWHQRSDLRAKFYTSVAKRAKEIATTLSHNKYWRLIFNDIGESRIRQTLQGSRGIPVPDVMREFQKVVLRLLSRLSRFQHNDKHDTLLVFVLDEASSLLHQEGSSKAPAGRYVALN